MRGSHLYPGVKKDMGTWGFGEEVWDSMAAPEEDVESFQMSKEHFPCLCCKANAVTAVPSCPSEIVFFCCLFFLPCTLQKGLAASVSVSGNSFMCLKPVEQLHARGVLNKNSGPQIGTFDHVEP
jgi:hypothetical protein